MDPPRNGRAGAAAGNRRDSGRHHFGSSARPSSTRRADPDAGGESCVIRRANVERATNRGGDAFAGLQPRADPNADPTPDVRTYSYSSRDRRADSRADARANTGANRGTDCGTGRSSLIVGVGRSLGALATNEVSRDAGTGIVNL